ncbi:MAG: SpoIID/LytB domain-containing protein, partial [Bacteroidales bacterium]
QNGYPYEYEQYAEIVDNHILFNGDYFEELDLIPHPNGHPCSFTLNGVTIGINFHWEREEDQTFNGILRLIANQGELHAINILPVEEYLKSVISSEMSATSNKELLKAHAVISRSWVLSQLEKKEKVVTRQINNSHEIVRWYDREDHHLFDVCADDHCQRYQGISRITASLVEKAIDETYGELLMAENKICDARFSKCCGGITERFENCWENTPYPYLQPVYDHPAGMRNVHAGMVDYIAAEKEALPSDLTDEEFAEEWIRNDPSAFCNTTDKQILTQVLNHYDQETPDFYRWQVSFSQKEISDLIHKRTGIDFGLITDLIPVERGESGRIIRLKIIGTKRTMIIGKELEIRKILSETHLYSSAFVIDKIMGNNEIPEKFILTGAGWGHGVGLCQIGAAVMSQKGYGYKEILAHYFRTALVNKAY